MSGDVLLAVSDGEHVFGYHRDGAGEMRQVAQFVAGQTIDPAKLAAVVADLGDTFGWAGAPTTSGPAGRALPAARTPSAARRAPRAIAPRKRVTPEEAETERVAILAYIGQHPECTRRDLAAGVYGGRTDAATISRVTYRMSTILDQMVITPGTGIEPDRFRLRAVAGSGEPLAG